MNKKVLFIFILAFLVRIIALNQSLWLDEATTAKVVREYGFMQIINEFSPNDFHPPLYYLVMKAWTNIFGYSEIALRFPSILFSLLAGIIIYKIAGIWAATFFLFNPLIIYYSQEARMYMMTVFFLSASLHFFIKIEKKPQSQNAELKTQNLKDIILFNLFNILSFYTFYGSIFLIASFLLYFLYKRKYRLFFLSILPILFVLLLISPLLLLQFKHARQSLQIVTKWSVVLGKASLKNLLLIPLKFSIGRISFDPKILYYSISGLWTLFVFYCTSKGGLKNKLLLYLFIFPLFLGLLFSFFSPLLQYFRFLYLIPLMSLLLAISVKRGVYDRAVRVIVGVGFLFFSLIYLLLPQFHREDWKSLVFSLRDSGSVYMISSSSDPVRYYNPSLKVKELRTLEAIELKKQAIVVPYTADIYGFDYKKELMKRGFTYKEAKTFRGLWYEVWVKNKDYTHTGSFRYSFITAKT